MNAHERSRTWIQSGFKISIHYITSEGISFETRSSVAHGSARTHVNSRDLRTRSRAMWDYIELAIWGIGRCEVYVYGLAASHTCRIRGQKAQSSGDHGALGRSCVYLSSGYRYTSGRKRANIFYELWSWDAVNRKAVELYSHQVAMENHIPEN